MNNPSALVLLGLIAWTLLLLVAMESLRTRVVLNGSVASNAFRPDNANLSPFMQRLARAHANCLEGLPVLGGLLVVALLTGHTQTSPICSRRGCWARASCSRSSTWPR